MRRVLNAEPSPKTSANSPAAYPQGEAHLADRARLCSLGLRGDPGCTLGPDHGLSAGKIGRERTEGVRHPSSEP